jgi:adenylyltransferase/sulfurtransferase
MEFREVKLRRDPNCAVCGPKPTVTELVDYHDFCGEGRGGEVQAVASEFDMEPDEAKTMLEKDPKTVLLDVREPHEYEIVHIEGSKLIPLGELHTRTNELDTADNVLVYCHHGNRSLQAIKTLQHFGFRKLKHIRGGIESWAVEVDPEMARY